MDQDTPASSSLLRTLAPSPQSPESRVVVHLWSFVSDPMARRQYPILLQPDVVDILPQNPAESR